MGFKKKKKHGGGNSLSRERVLKQIWQNASNW